MKIKIKSDWSGIETIRDLPITFEQLERYQRGDEKIQDIFPNLSPRDREWLRTGLTDEEQDKIFGSKES